jgi:hypothetical protein
MVVYISVVGVCGSITTVSGTSRVDERGNLRAKWRWGGSAQDATAVEISVGDIEYRLPFHGKSATHFLDSLCIIITSNRSFELTLTLM